MEMFKRVMAEYAKTRMIAERSRCDHPNADTTFQWNGLTYCNHCCEHSFGHTNFAEDLDDGFYTCTKCWTVIDYSIGHPEFHPKPGNRKRKRTKPEIPKIVLTNCMGEDKHITRITRK
jgi:hypothetical protein